MRALLSAPSRVVLGAVLLMVGLAPGAPVRAAEPHSALSIIFENDLFYHTDRDYTNGVEATWSPPAKGAEFLPAALEPYSRIFLI